MTIDWSKAKRMTPEEREKAMKLAEGFARQCGLVVSAEGPDGESFYYCLGDVGHTGDHEYQTQVTCGMHPGVHTIGVYCIDPRTT